jgi:hypothetical protein
MIPRNPRSLIVLEDQEVLMILTIPLWLKKINFVRTEEI